MKNFAIRIDSLPRRHRVGTILKLMIAVSRSLGEAAPRFGEYPHIERSGLCEEEYDTVPALAVELVNILTPNLVTSLLSASRCEVGAWRYVGVVDNKWYFYDELNRYRIEDGEETTVEAIMAELPGMTAKPSTPMPVEAVKVSKKKAPLPLLQQKLDFVYAGDMETAPVRYNVRGVTSFTVHADRIEYTCEQANANSTIVTKAHVVVKFNDLVSVTHRGPNMATEIYAIENGKIESRTTVFDRKQF